MYKSVSLKPEWHNTHSVTDIYSVSGCVSKDFDDGIDYWKHNGYWFFDSPNIIENIANENDLSLEGMKVFFYLAHDEQWNNEIEVWEPFSPEESFDTSVVLPECSTTQGYDIVCYSCQTSAECSPLSCNHMPQEIEVNSHCLLPSLDVAMKLIESGLFKDCEPGPYRILEVQSVENA